MELDLAVLELLQLDPSQTRVSSFGHGTSSASTAKITTKLSNGSEKLFFMKTLRGDDGPLLMEGEQASLRAIHSAVPGLCSQPLGLGTLRANPSESFLIIEYLQTWSPWSPIFKAVFDTFAPRPRLAMQLAKLHTTPAPIPHGHTKPQFGFPKTTFCGDTPQDNSFRESWAEFYAENRLRFILRRCEQKHGEDAELRELVEATATVIVSRLLGDDHLNGGRGVTPVIVHGDLWFGNVARGSIDGGPLKDIIFDPAACYAHSEYELGIMRMFGGFSSSFFAKYHTLCPQTEPVEEYEDRILLYELYHYLNHYAIFGNAYKLFSFNVRYKAGAMKIMRGLLRKYHSS